MSLEQVNLVFLSAKHVHIKLNLFIILPADGVALFCAVLAEWS